MNNKNSIFDVFMIKGPRVTSKNTKKNVQFFIFSQKKHKVHKSTFDIGKSHHQQNKPVYSLLKIDFIMVHTSVRPH